MELWEKEYLEVIQQLKRAPAKPRKARINKCWEEVTLPDGSKWYVPKQKAFRKQKQKYRESRIPIGIKKLGKAILIMALVLVIVFVLTSHD